MLDPTQFTIVIASPEQEEQHARGQFVPWARGRSWEDFFAIHQQERTEGTWSKDNGLLTWVLVRWDALDGEIYAGCETYRRTALVKRKGSQHVESATTYGIASVITPVKHLRQGYATHLLKLLHYTIGNPSFLPPFPSSWGKEPPISRGMQPHVPRAISSILWSDVGSTFYEKCTIGESRPGWSVRDDRCSELVWRLLPPEAQASSSAHIKELYDASGVAGAMSASLEQALRDTDASQRSIWTTDPTSPGVVEFVAAKGRYGAQPEERDMAKPEVVGLKYRGPNAEDDTTILFTNYNSSLGPRLLVTSTVRLETHPERLPVLLVALDKCGAAAKRTEGWIWGLDKGSELVKAWQSIAGREAHCGRRDEKDGHLLGVAWYGEEGDVDMLDTTMWTWC